MRAILLVSVGFVFGCSMAHEREDIGVAYQVDTFSAPDAASASDAGPIAPDAGMPDAGVRAFLTVARSASSPSGLSTGTPDQFVAAFVFTNDVNTGSHPATVEGIAPRLVSTVRTSELRAVTIWKDAIGPGENVLGRYLVGPGDMLDTLTPPWFHTLMPGLEVAAGESRSAFVTADTRDAHAGDTLTVDLPAASVTYSDGVTSGIVPTSLPVSGATLAY